MLEFPISKDTFKKSFLDGNGSFEVTTPQSTWEALINSDKPFPDAVESVAKLSFRAGSKFKFGEQHDLNKGLKLNADVSASASNEIRLIRSKTDPLIKSYQLQQYMSDDMLYAAVLLGATAAAQVEGSLPTGPLTATFGIGAGGNVAYERLVRFKRSASARTILADLFAQSRLPQDVDAPAEIPAEGEVLALRYGGYLNLSAGLTWGYSFSGTKAVDVLDFSLALKYAVRVAASASFKYGLAAEFSGEARRGQDANWVRYVVRKSREATSEFAADLSLDFKADLEGLPESPDKLLAALLGTHAKGVLDKLAAIEQNASLDKLQEKLGKLVSGFVLKRADNWLGKALDSNTVAEFLGVAHQIIDAYEKIDERIIGLYEDFLDGKLPQLSAQLGRLIALTGRDALKDLPDGEVWDLIRRLWGERFYNLLLRDSEFKQFIALVKEAKAFVDGGKDKLDALVHKFIADVKKEFPLDGLFNELAKYDEPAELKKLADEKIQGLVAVVIGKAFAELQSNDDFKQASQKLKAVADQLANFRNAYANNLKKVVHQNFAASVSLAYKSASKGEVLLDVEIDLSHPDGPELARQAARGHFVEVLDRYRAGVVRINQAKLTHDLTKSTQVQVTIWNWKYRHLAEIIQHSEHSVEAAPLGGLLHIYSIDTSSKETTEKTGWNKFKELVKTNFTLSVVGQTFQPQGSPSTSPDGQFLVETLARMGVQYELLYEDERTNPAELTQYLLLSDQLKLGSGSTVLVSDLTRQFPVPPGLGKVSVNYVVRYNDAAVRAAFLNYDVTDKAQEELLKNYVRDTARLLVAANLTGMREKDWQPALGFAYSSTNVYQMYHASGSSGANFELNDITVKFPSWFVHTGPATMKLRVEQKRVLFGFYVLEDLLVSRLTKLYRVIRQANTQGIKVSEKELRDASKDFLAVSDGMNKEGGENTFFAVFDKLVQKTAGAGVTRDSTMILEITPLNAKTLPSGEKEKVVKFLSS